MKSIFPIALWHAAMRHSMRHIKHHKRHRRRLEFAPRILARAAR